MSRNSETLKRLTAAFPHSDVPADTIHLWNEYLSGLDNDAAVAAATRECIETLRFFPSWSEFLTAYRKHAPKQSRTIYDHNQGGFYVAPERRRELEARRAQTRELTE